MLSSGTLPMALIFVCPAILRGRRPPAHEGPGLEDGGAMTVKFDFWACQRPLTHGWGSGQVFPRLSLAFGKPDIVFGSTDNIPPGTPTLDLKNGYDWKRLPFQTQTFRFGYWDPPYPKVQGSMMKREGQEIWRVCHRLAILSTHIYPRSWFPGAIREGMVAVTMGPLKQIRCLQVFKRMEGRQE